jgi:hypothetical protein
MSFVNPTYLWCLLGLLIPLAIHLWSKKEGKTIKIGSIKLFSEEDSKQSSSISINELLLLFLRFLMITFVVLIMAEPQFKRETQNTALTYIFETSLVNNDKISFLIDSLKKEFPVLLLKKEFPKLEEPTLEDSSYLETPNYWQLAKDMEALKTDSIVVFTNALLKGIKGKRPTINKPIDWIIVNTAQSKEHLINAVLKKDSLQLLSVVNKPDNLSFIKRTRSLNSSKIKLNATKDSISLEQNNTQIKHLLLTEQTLDVLLYFEDNFTNQATYLETALNTISKYLNKDIKIYKSQDSTTFDIFDFDRVIWLSENNTVKPNRKTLSYKIDDLSRTMITKGDTQNIAYISQPITPDNILDKQFAKHLINWLDLHPDLEKNMTPFDSRMVSKAELLPIYKNNSKKSNLYIETWSITKWLCVVLALLIIFERIIAYLRKQ